MKDVEIIGMLKTYVVKSLIGVGALKGAPCKIKSIVKASGINTVTFEWTDNNGDTQESTMLVYDGAPGADGISPTITVKTSSSSEYVLTITDKNGSFDTPNLKGSGGGGGASVMSDLTDVDLTALANGSVLMYDSTSAKWEATALSLSDISGIDIAGITDGQILAWDVANNKFVPADNTGEEYTAGEGIEISQDNKISSKIVMYTGTKAAWDALPLADKKKYTHASFTDDTESGVVDSVPREDSENLVTSGGVFAALEDKADKTDLDDKADIATTLAGYGITDTYTKTETDNAITAEIEKLDVSDAAVAGSYVTEVSEADGKISVVRETADATPTANSTKMLTSGGAKTALDAKQDTLTFDNAPTENSNNPVKSNGLYVANRNIHEVMGKNGAKNFFAFNRSPYIEAQIYNLESVSDLTENSVTITSQNKTYAYYGLHYDFPAGTYKFSFTGTTSDISFTPKITIYIKQKSDNSIVGYAIPTLSGQETEFTITDEQYANFRLFVTDDTAAVRTITFTNGLVRLASDTDPTYQPYAKTNHQLTEDSVTWDNLGEVGAVNYLPKGESADKYNTHYTVNADGTISVTTGTGGDTPASSNNGIYKDVTLKAGTYRLSGCPSGGGSKYYTSIESLNARDTGNGVIFTIDSEQTLNVTLARINNTTDTYNGLVFKPMITPVDYNGPYVPYAKTNRELTEETDVTLTPDTSNFSIVSYKIKKRDGHVYGYIDAKVVNVSGVSVGTLSEKPSYTWAQAACNSTHRAADNVPTICYVNNQGVIAINPANVFIVDDRIQIAIDFYTSL